MLEQPDKDIMAVVEYTVDTKVAVAAELVKLVEEAMTPAVAVMVLLQVFLVQLCKEQVAVVVAIIVPEREVLVVLVEAALVAEELLVWVLLVLQILVAAAEEVKM